MTGYRIAVPTWFDGNDISKMIAHELSSAGHQPICFGYDKQVPDAIDLLLTFGPYEKILPVWERVASGVPSNSRGSRPIVIHWNTEGMPDLRIPFPMVHRIAAIRSWIGRLSHSDSSLERRISALGPVLHLDRRLFRYRYQGDYAYAMRKGWLHLLADSSQIYTGIRCRGGTPTLYAPWGGSEVLYKDLGLERDIDVIWIGKRGTPRRSRILDQVCRELGRHGVKMHIADNELNPFLFNSARTQYLNRAKITLNITRTWYDDNFSRFVMAAPNRSLIVSEPVLSHCPEFKPGVHYVSASIGELSKTILHLLEHEDEMRPIVENAYQLVTRDLQFINSLRKMIASAEGIYGKIHTGKVG